MPIHPTAIVDRSAELDPSVDVGAYAIIESDVRIAAGTRIFPHVFISSHTTIGQRCVIHPFAVIGHLPQDVKYKNEPSFTVIGDDCIIREHATIHRGTTPGSMTSLGARCFVMSTAHVGHNCTVGDDVVLVNGMMLAGHVSVGNRAFISGNSGIHQFCRIGELVMVANTRVTMDVPPFMTVGPHGIIGTNVVGLRRAGFSAAERLEVRNCYKLLYRSGLPFKLVMEQIEAIVRSDPGRRLFAFLSAPSKRGIIGPAKRRRIAKEQGDDES